MGTRQVTCGALDSRKVVIQSTADADADAYVDAYVKMKVQRTYRILNCEFRVCRLKNGEKAVAVVMDGMR